MAVLLYVDDDPAFLELVEAQLDRRLDDVAIETTTDASAVLTDLEGFGNVHCVLTDYDMSPLDGIELLEGIRSTAADLPVVLYTSRGSEAVASEAISAGVTDYVRKGGTSDHYDLLANRLRSAIDHYRTRREATALTRRQSRILRHTTERFLFLDRDWTIVDLNDRTAEVFGAENGDREALLGENFLDLAAGIVDDPEDNPFLTAYRFAMANDEPTEVVGRPEAKGEPGRWIEARVRPSPDGLAIFVRDVSYRERHRRRFRRLLREGSRFSDRETAAAVYRTVTDLATAELGFDGCAVFTSEEGRLVSVARSLGGSASDDAVAFDETAAAASRRHGRARRGGEDRPVPDADVAAPFTISVPLGDDGVVQVVSTERTVPDESDVELVELLADRAGTALDRIDRERLLVERNERIASLQAELQAGTKRPATRRS
ncbi:response regulator [Halorubrum vacuolatum]|nr:response regulator [Halorubrum vacuolatum]